MNCIFCDIATKRVHTNSWIEIDAIKKEELEIKLKERIKIKCKERSRIWKYKKIEYLVLLVWQ